MYLRIILIIISFFFLSCEPEPSPDTFANNFGKGTYILTDNGLSFIKKNTDVVEDQVIKNTNGIMIQDPKNLSIYGSRLYIVGKDFYALDINTLEVLGQVGGFTNASACAIIPQNRAFVADKDESLVKLIDLNDYNITSEIETGENTSPSFIINKYDKSFVLNGGNDQMYDSTLITITYKDDLIPLADFSGNLIIGKNPNSALSTGNIKVLCSGVYDLNNPSNNTESSFYNIYPTDLLINFSEDLSGIYNAKNLVESSSGNNFYFTAEGGVYRTNTTVTNINPIISIDTDVLNITSEQYAVNDTTNAYSNILYMNDLNNLGKVYKYNVNLSSFVDTISVNGNVLDIIFK
jgi:hypothetical protein